MSSPIDPEKLLRQARALAGIGAGRGRPSPTNHRRAVSAAYYALFHAITLAVVRHVLPSDASDEEVRRATRWIDHKDIRVVCEAIATCAAATTPVAGLPKGLPGRAEAVWLALSTPAGTGRVSAVPGDLRFVAAAFGTLIAARHAADYDHSAPFPKTTAIGHVADAAQAVQMIAGNVEDPFFERFLAWIMARASAFAL